MPTVPTLDAALDAIRLYLAEGLPGVPVERARRSPINQGEALPRLVLRLGPIAAQPDDSFGLTLWRCQVAVEGYVAAAAGSADPDAALETAMADLSARCDAALTASEILVGTEGLSIMPEAVAFAPEAALIETAAESVGGFTWTFAFDLRVPIETGAFTTVP